MIKEIQSILDSYQTEMTENLQKLIRIKSVASGPKENAPFGEGIQKSLEFILALGGEKGFECINFENYACEINYGEGEEAVGAVLHLDVVPEGSGWTHDPYGGEISNGNIYGRGAVDDKGPLIAVFYACCAIKESGLPLKKKIKQIIGTNEEGGVFPCLRYYKEHAQLPGCGIVPDSWFPAVYAEKGFFDFEFSGKFEEKDEIKNTGIRLLQLNGGEALNIVAPSAEAVFLADEPGIKTISQAIRSQKENDLLTLKQEGERVTIKIKGKAAHASAPELGVNAIANLLSLLKEFSFQPAELCKSIHRLAEMAGKDHDGTGLGIDGEDHTGKLTNNLGLISYKNNEFSLKMNIRCPITIKPEELERKLKQQADTIRMECRLQNYNPHFYIPEEHPLIQMLSGVYQDITGDTKTKPKAHGGGSYARILNNFIPFGPSIEGEELCFHKQDEFISCERLLLLSKIYAEALFKLATQ